MRSTQLLCLISTSWLAALTLAQNRNTPPNILEAINICREKLKVDPHFPKVQYALAQLLESQISPPGNRIDDTGALVHEVLQLYRAVGQPSTNVTEKRIPTAQIKFQSLFRAGTIAKDIPCDKMQAIEYYTLAMNLDGIDSASILLAFQTMMPILLSLVVKNSIDQRNALSIEPNGNVYVDSPYQTKLIQNAFDACALVEKKCPTESIVDEYRGATLRLVNQPEFAYQSYLRAMEKSKQSMKDRADSMSDQILQLADYVRASVLVAAAAREAGYDYHVQMSYLNDAKNEIEPILPSLDEQSDTVKAQIVELYNNLGIAEKRNGSISRAREFFIKTLAINPNDGHALVQLASITDVTGIVDEVVSSVKELDSEYVSALFDGYSSRFESELVDVLGYKGHSLVYDALEKSLIQLGKSPISIKRIIDLGCGTGLLGNIISNEMPWVTIEGVDLSQRMVEISRERKSKRGSNVYATVTHEDAGAYLSTLKSRTVDCILASDVFIYIGDISKVLVLSSAALIDRGFVGFTVEKFGGPSLRLLPSGRFGHSQSYIEEVAALSGFEVLSWEDCILRQQGGQDVMGSTVILRKMR